MKEAPFNTPDYSQPATSQVPALDGVRGIAILWVIIHNTSTLPMTQVEGAFYLLKLFTNPGWIGVQIFFALSGFLITGKLLDSRDAANYYSGFYAKRFLRIFPLYYGVLVTFLLVPSLLHSTPDSLRAATDNQWWLWLFISNFAPLSLNGFGHFWSLAVEEQFYLVWPLLLHRLRPQQVLSLCTAIAATAFAIRCAMVVHGADAMVIYNSTFCRMDALAAGGAAAALVRMPRGMALLRQHATAISIAAIVLFIFGAVTTTGFYYGSLTCQTYGYAILSLCCAVLTVYAAIPPETRALCSVNGALSVRWLRSLGKYSFCMYVAHGLFYKLVGDHFVIQHFGPRLPPAVGFGYTVAILLISYVIAVISYHAYEKHFLRLKSAFEPRPQSGQKAVNCQSAPECD